MKTFVVILLYFGSLGGTLAYLASGFREPLHLIIALCFAIMARLELLD